MLRTRESRRERSEPTQRKPTLAAELHQQDFSHESEGGHSDARGARYGGRATAEMRRQELQRMQRQHGNAYVRRVLSQGGLSTYLEKPAVRRRAKDEDEAQPLQPTPQASTTVDTAQPNRVQRFGLDDVTNGLSSAYNAATSTVGSVVQAGEDAVGQALQLPSGALDFLTGAANSARGVVGQATQWGQTFGPQAIAGLQQQAGALNTSAQASAAKGQQAGQATKATAQQASGQINQAGQQLQQKGANAQGQFNGMGPALKSLASPVTAATHPERIAAAEQQVNSAASSASAAGGTAGSQMAQNAQNAAGGQTWDCSEKAILAKVGGVAQDVLNTVESTPVVGDVVKFGESMAKTALDDASYVKDQAMQMASDAKAWIADEAKPITDMADSALSTVEENYNAAKDVVTQEASELKKGFVDTWNEGKEAVVSAAHQTADSVRQGINNGISSVRNFLGGLGSALMALLPDNLKSLVGDLGGMINDAVQGLETAKQAIVDEAVQLKNGAIDAAKAVGDEVLQDIAQNYQDAKQLAHEAVDLAKQGEQAVVDSIPDWVKEPVGDAYQWASDEAGQLKDAAMQEAAAVGGEVCSAISDVASPCVDRLMPAVPDATNSVKLTAAADATIPLEEVGVPANLEVKQGSSIEISRKDKVFTVTIIGEGALNLTDEFGEDASVKVDTGSNDGGGSGAQAGQQAAVFNKLANTAPAAASGGGSGAGAGSGGGGGSGDSVKAAVKAGFKGNVTTKYQFTMGATNCDGIGGMVGLLASYGVAEALPSPFSGLAQAAGQAAFQGNMTSCLFSLGEAAEGSVELKGGDIASLKAALAAEATATMGVQRDAQGNLITVRNLTLSGTVSGEGSAQLLPGMKDVLKLGEAASGTLKLILSFLNDEIQPTTLSAEAKGSVTLSSSFDIGSIQSLLPADAAKSITSVVNSLKESNTGGSSEKLEAKATFTVKDLNPLMRRLDQYFSGPIDSVTTDGVLDLLREELSALQTESNLTITLTDTNKLGISAKGKVGEGAAIGLGGSVGAEHSIAHTLYSGPIFGH